MLLIRLKSHFWLHSKCQLNSVKHWSYGVSQFNHSRRASSSSVEEQLTVENSHAVQQSKHASSSNGAAQNLHEEKGECFNQVNIQMLYNNLHQQVFGTGVERPSVKEDVLRDVVSHLKAHELWGKPTSEQSPVPLTVPRLEGDLDSHFRNIAEQVSRPYREEAEKLCREDLPEPPREWSVEPGWTQYCAETGTVTPVSFPTCSGLVFDVEVLMSEGQFPTMATAASPTAWYSWCSPRVFSINKHAGKVRLCDLIAMETSDDSHRPTSNQWTNRLIIGHNVSFDRSFIKEQYYIDASRTQFLDTMSLHISVCGLTATQKILYQAFRKGETGFSRKEIRDKFRPNSMQSFQWTDESSMNNLKDVHQLYCSDQSPISKETRDIFMKGNMEDVREQYQELMSYCAADVRATHAVHQKLWPEFNERLPHPVTFTGLLQMGTAYLPIRSSWQRYVSSADQVYTHCQDQLRDTLMGLAEEAVELWKGKRYQDDLWLWDMDWATRNVRGDKPESSTEEESQTEKRQEKGGKLRRRPSKAYPVWYADLLPRAAEKAEGMPEGPSKISTLRRCTPKLLRLTWHGFPLHHHKEQGWGYLKPAEGSVNCEERDDVLDELLKQEKGLTGDEEEVQEQDSGFPLRQFLDYCAELHHYQEKKRSVQELDKIHLQISALEKQLEESEDEDTKITLHREIKQIQRLAGRSKKKKQVNKSQREEESHDIGIPGVQFFRLPHKDGPKNRVGSPLSKDYLAHIETRVLGSALGEQLDTVHSLSKMCSYWKNNMKRIHSQIDVELMPEALPETVQNSLDGVEDQYVGAIIPRLITAGTVTRRAVESTWLTASNAYADRIGSELKSMVQSPPGYCFVGADVDSQELWIAAVLGDSYSGRIHGCTALGWMTLQGNKTNGTDLHSKVAALLGISRDHAKVFNYGRIYGAGQMYAKQLLMQFNHTLSEQKAEKKAKELYRSTKGVRRRNSTSNRWVGGSESAMFNKLESVIMEDQPQTPVLGCRISKTLEPSKVNHDFLTSRINWVVQSSAVDYLHLLLVSMAWLCEKYDIHARFCISIHDEVRYLVKHEDRYRAALALQITNLLTRSMFAYKLGMNDLPQSVAFFSSVDLDTCLRKEVYMDCVTPSNPDGMEKGYSIQPGQSLSIYDIIEKTGGSLYKESKIHEELTKDILDLG